METNDPNARPLWMGDAANVILDNWSRWDGEAAQTSAVAQDSEAGEYHLLGQIESAIDDAYRKEYGGPERNVFPEWTCIFPGKMGLSWKRAWDGIGTRKEAEIQARKNCNVIAVPVELFEKMKEHERRMVEAERKLDELQIGPGLAAPTGDPDRGRTRT